MSVLKRLKDERVVNFEVSRDGQSIEVTEMCDEWYTESITKDDFEVLIMELNLLKDKLK